VARSKLSVLVKWAVTLAALAGVGIIVRHDSRMMHGDGGPSSGASTFASGSARAKYYVTTLASDRMEGRLTGSPGERASGDYIISELRRIGAGPLPGRDFRFPFQFTAGGRDGGSSITIAATDCRECQPLAAVQGTSEVQALSFSDDGDVTAPVVFAGYGIVVPDSQNFGYDSYATLDVTRTRTRRRKASCRATRISATRRSPRASTAPKHCSS